MTKVAIVGVGNLGTALVNYNFTVNDRMQIVAAFDQSEDVVGNMVGKLTIDSMDDFEKVLEELGIEVVILTVPQQAAQKVADRITKAGITGILNFTPQRVNVPEKVQVHHIDLGIELQSLIFFMKNQ